MYYLYKTHVGPVCYSGGTHIIFNWNPPTKYVYLFIYMKIINIFHTLHLHVLAPTTYWILIPLRKLAKYNCMTIHELYLL